MSPKIEQLVEQSRQLSREERAELVDRLTIEMCSDGGPEYAAEWVQEAERRLDELNSGKVRAVPGDEVMARARKIVGL